MCLSYGLSIALALSAFHCASRDACDRSPSAGALRWVGGRPAASIMEDAAVGHSRHCFVSGDTPVFYPTAPPIRQHAVQRSPQRDIAAGAAAKITVRHSCRRCCERQKVGIAAGAAAEGHQVWHRRRCLKPRRTPLAGASAAAAPAALPPFHGPPAQGSLYIYAYRRPSGCPPPADRPQTRSTPVPAGKV